MVASLYNIPLVVSYLKCWLTARNNKTSMYGELGTGIVRVWNHILKKILIQDLSVNNN